VTRTEIEAAIALARDLKLRGALPSADVVFLRQSLVAALEKIDLLYAALCAGCLCTCSGCSGVDQRRLDWLTADDASLLDVRGRMVNEGASLREAIDWFMQAEARPCT